MSVDRVIFLRHGQTDYNRLGRVQGHVDIELNDDGLAQAKAAGAALASYLVGRPATIVSSDLSRAFVTAQCCAGELGVEVATDERMRERAFGQFEGLGGDELRERYPEAYAHWRAGGTPAGLGIEEKTLVGQRMSEAVREYIEAGESGHTLVVVSHGSAITQTLRAILGIADLEQPVLRGLDNCHWAEIEAGATGWRLRAHNVSAG
ncbi:hypothetical protein BSZ39_03055 [Bowdeniella nasicola]|uniref:Phosphoglycerate mutase n=1 Tax=Bowdeniella nasicola TaxID=208480 RepID=A0A1Q5Q4Q8_9ACTO|nr:histidine phosphatase family protein [Bowdeniella nasicola]OKL54679.1 hypothetical protein BSZ39_03055 [Bowdeniella nasicola]